MSRILALVLVCVLAVALIGGSAYILLRSDEASANSGEQHGQGNGRSGAGSAGWENAAGDGYRGGSNGNGQGKRGANGTAAAPLADRPAETWLVLTGTVTAFEDGVLTVETADGVLEAHLGPTWYSEGMAVAVGDQVAVTGFFDEDGEFEVAAVENLSTGEDIALREESGRPLWAGKGRRGR